MEEKKEKTKYNKNDFKFNFIYDKTGKSLEQIIEETFRNYCELKSKV